MATTATSRSLDRLRKKDWFPWVVEFFCNKKTKDTIINSW